jgi:hypothetical protein
MGPHACVAAWVVTAWSVMELRDGYGDDIMTDVTWRCCLRSAAWVVVVWGYDTT